MPCKGLLVLLLPTRASQAVLGYGLALGSGLGALDFVC